MNRVSRCLLLLIAIGVLWGQAEAQLLSREALIADTRQLVHLLETVHPDPYINGGGKIAFHRRFHEVVSSIPDSGLTAVDFGWRLQRFVGWLGDPHTSLRVPVQVNDSRPGGIPIYLNAVEDVLYTYGYIDTVFDPPVGSVLLSVERVPIKEIIKRHANLTGNKSNVYNALALLRGNLWNDFWIEQLIPEWTNREQIRTELRHPDGTVKEYAFDIPPKVDYPLHYTATKINLPSTRECDFVYKFMDEKKETALLRIDAMDGFREAFEMWKTIGRSQLIRDRGKRPYERAHGTPPPEGEDSLIAGIPSATETFVSLLKEMREAGTKNLIVDLRRNSGGNSIMADILVYLIYGEEELLSNATPGSEVKKLSDYYFVLHTTETIDSMGGGKEFPLTANDYRFLEDKHGWKSDLTARLREIAEESWHRKVSRMHTFKRYYDDGSFDGYYRPPNVVVVTSSSTFSSGWTLMYKLRCAGASIVGRPSGQEPNAFGSIQEFTLQNSKIDGYVSHMRFDMFPEDLELAHVVKPQYEMTYDILKSYEFDRNADILYALKVLSEK